MKICDACGMGTDELNQIKGVELCNRCTQKWVKIHGKRFNLWIKNKQRKLEIKSKWIEIVGPIIASMIEKKYL